MLKRFKKEIQRILISNNNGEKHIKTCIVLQNSIILHHFKNDKVNQQYNGFLAQLVEQWIENPCVPGSIPGETT